MKIVISSGHGKYIRGASGYLDEVNEARLVVEEVADILRGAPDPVEVITFHDDVSDDQSENLNRIVNFHNAQNRDLDISVHFNAFETTSKPMGTECLFVSQETLAAIVSDKVAAAGHLIDRGAKYRSDLYFLNKTEMPSILIETCFVDSSADADLYRDHFGAICLAIAEAVSGQDIGSGAVPPDQPARPPRPERPPPVEAEQATVEITTRGPVTVTVNGQTVVSVSTMGGR